MSFLLNSLNMIMQAFIINLELIFPLYIKCRNIKNVQQLPTNAITVYVMHSTSYTTQNYIYIYYRSIVF